MQEMPVFFNNFFDGLVLFVVTGNDSDSLFLITVL